MTNPTSIARPYAKAAFEAAKEANQLAMWSSSLKQLSLIAQDADMQSILENPQYTKMQLTDLIISCLHPISGNGSQTDFFTVDNFIRILSEKKRLSLLPIIFELFEQDCAIESGHLFLVVTSAFEIDATQQKNTKEKLEKQFNL